MVEAIGGEEVDLSQAFTILRVVEVVDIGEVTEVVDIGEVAGVVDNGEVALSRESNK